MSMNVNPNKIEDNFNFGFQTVFYYLEQADDLFYLIDGFEPLEENGAYEGGLLMRALGSVLAINLSKETNDFVISIIDSEGSLQLVMLPTGEDLLMFLLGLRRELVDSKYFL
tara:strand:- start:3460 stop:3795 length:336 start_codon:yes stop_codon:yes gene_type:complete